LLLEDLIFVGFYIFEALIFLKHMDITPQFIDKSSGAMFEQIIGGNHDIESFSGFINVVLKGLNSFEDRLKGLLKLFDLKGKSS
jgi:hypothetical protein